MANLILYIQNFEKIDDFKKLNIYNIFKFKDISLSILSK